MNTIEFIPAEFHKVDINYNREQNDCSPCFDDRPNDINVIRINVPEKIILREYDIRKERPVFPVCIFSTVSYLRTLKYGESGRLELYVLNMEDDHEKNVLSGPVYNADKFPDEFLPPPFQNEIDKRRKQKVAEALKLTDEELDDSEYYPEFLNINLSEYIDFPFEPGRYEVWMSYYGLESDRKPVEIIVGDLIQGSQKRMTEK